MVCLHECARIRRIVNARRERKINGLAETWDAYVVRVNRTRLVMYACCVSNAKGDTAKRNGKLAFTFLNAKRKFDA